MRLRLTFAQRLTLGVGLIVVAVSGAHIAISLARITGELRARVIALGQARAGWLAHSVALPLVADDRPALEETLAAVVRDPEVVGAAVLGLGGQTVARVGAPRIDPGAVRRAPPEATWSEQGDRLQFLTPVRLGTRPEAELLAEEEPGRDEVVGWLVLDLSRSSYLAARRRAVLENALFAAALLIVALGVTHVLANRLARPLRELARAAARVGRGDFAARVPASGDDELGALQRRFNAMVEDLASLDETKRNIVANVSHELRTPLLPIRTLGELLDSSKLGPMTPAQRRACDLIVRNAGRLESMISSLLDFAMVYEGRGRMRTERLDLREVLADAARTGTELLKPGVRLEARVGDVELPVLGDRVRLERIFTNLVGNAAKFTHTTIELIGRLAGDWIEVEVRDDGIGIPPEVQPRIFERFFQADASSTRRYGGVGIGLALVKEFVDQHHGEVSVASTPGAGSTFTVRLPRATGAAAAARPPEARSPAPTRPPARPPAGAPRLRVLVVDDEPDNIEAISLLLEHAGYAITSASSGEEAIASVREEPPDLVILDVAMEGIDGFETCRRLRALEGGDELSIAMMTAHTGEHIGEIARECGADTVITKPYAADQLLADVEGLTAGGGGGP